MSASLPLEAFSRRRFVNTGVASFLLPMAFARAQNIAPVVPANPGVPPEDAAKIAADRDAASHLTIKVRINGDGPFRFVVDTGADRSVIAADVATRLGLLHDKQVLVEGVVRTIPAQTVRLDNLSFGPVSRDNLYVPVLPRALLGIDGYLGLDAIDGFRVTFDFKSRELQIARPRHGWRASWYPPNQSLVRVAGRAGHLRSMQGRADGIRVTTFIDSGAEISVGNSKLLEALMDMSPTYARPETVPLTGITGGIIQGRITSVKKIRLADLIFDGCDIVIADMQIFKLWDLDDTPALLIGMNFLRQFSKVSIDYGRKELTFELARLLVAQRA